ncbi:Uncharacterised protein [Arachnia propionica]|uniref:Uncharacterized protein n=1 Tax=Arachnia propionica TaxID=1750 RepID=A0A448N1Q1_9ACTN|nr:Uncharacterised protein [Arachnia propionica]
MESGLDGRNNLWASLQEATEFRVSMESGLDGRNNPRQTSSLNG